MIVRFAEINKDFVEVNWPEEFPIPHIDELFHFNDLQYRVRNVGYHVDALKAGYCDTYVVEHKQISLSVERT